MIKPFSYNYYKNLKRPHVYLSYPNRTQICELPVYEFQTDIIANSANRGTFKVYRYRDGIETQHYGDIELGMYLYIDGLSWFVITEINLENEGYNEYLEISYMQIEHILEHTNLTSFGSLGVESDGQGGLDRYCLHNPLDQPHSILHIFVQKNPAWSIGYVDPSISKEYRNFQNESVASYTFLTKDVSESYECIFLFDPDTLEVNVYKLENLGKDTGIILSYRNFVKSIKQKSDDSDVKTVLTVSGGNDARTNTPLGIMDVNISGTNQIYNFSYYLHMMSQELKVKLSQYEKKCKENTPTYQQKLKELGKLYVELNDLKNKAPDNLNSTDWGKYGEAQLQEKEQEFWQRMSLYVGKDDNYSTTQYNTYKPIHDAIESELGKRKKQISSKESEITSCQRQANSLVVKINEFLGDKLYKELSLYVKEDVLTDDSFVATDIMTDSEILEMQQSLIKHATSELAKVCIPKLETEIDLINFTLDYDYNEFTRQLDMFNIIHIQFEDSEAVTDARLLKLHLNWDNPDDFKATFSNRGSIDEAFAIFKEVINQTEDNSSSLSYGVGAWTSAATVSPEIRDYMNSIFDASKQMLQSSENQEVRVDRTGLLIRKWNGDSEQYDPGQAWMTNGGIFMTRDGWDSVSLALGYTKVGNDYFYGLCCESLVGKVVLASNLYISNESGNYTMDKDGLVAKNGSYQVKIKPSAPADIFSITVDNKKLLYIDANKKKLKFEGDIESTSGHIANFLITQNNLTSGGVGLCSLTTSGEIAIWAGNANKASAPFRVTNRGKLVCSDIEVTGGIFKIGDIGKNDNTGFGVSNNGTLTAKNANISGNLVAKTGEIGAFSIVDGELISKSKNTYIRWGDFYINGNEMNINNTIIDEGGFYIGYIDARWESDTGNIYANEFYSIKERNWGHNGVLFVLEKLWEQVFKGGWTPCGSNDCNESDICPSNDECPGNSGCNEHLTDDIGGCGGGCDNCESGCNGCNNTICSGDCDGAEGPGCV